MDVCLPKIFVTRETSSECGRFRPCRRVQDAAPDFRPVRMRIHKARTIVFPRNINHLGARRTLPFAPTPLDAVVLHHDIGVFTTFV